MSTGIKIYYNIVNDTMYDSNGAMYGNSILTAYFNNHLDLEVNYMVDTSADSMQNWIPWTGLADKAVSSVVSFDRDYAHAVKGKTTTTTTGATSINVSVNIPEVELNYSDVLIAYRPDGSTITLPYNGFIYGSSSVEFLLEGTVPEDIPSGLNVRVPRSLYLKMQGDDIDNSLAAKGIFTFHTYLMSKKLLESLDYSDSEYLRGTMEHKIVFDGDVVRTFSFPFNITNLLDYNGEADVPETGNWASKEYVDSRIAASGGGGGGGGAVPTITINNITPNQEGAVTLYGDDIYVQSPGDGTYQDSFNWWEQSLKQCTIYQSIRDLYEYSAYKIVLLGGNEFTTQNGIINLTISPYDVLVREQYNEWGQVGYQTNLYDALADLNYAKMGTPYYYEMTDTSQTGESYELNTYYSECRSGWVFVRITAGEQDGTACAQINGNNLCHTNFHAGQMASFSFPVGASTEWMIFDCGDPESDATYEIFFVPTDQLPY